MQALCFGGGSGMRRAFLEDENALLQRLLLNEQRDKLCLAQDVLALRAELHRERAKSAALEQEIQMAARAAQEMGENLEQYLEAEFSKDQQHAAARSSASADTRLSHDQVLRASAHTCSDAASAQLPYTVTSPEYGLQLLSHHPAASLEHNGHHQQPGRGAEQQLPEADILQVAMHLKGFAESCYDRLAAGRAAANSNRAAGHASANAQPGAAPEQAGPLATEGQAASDLPQQALQVSQMALQLGRYTAALRGPGGDAAAHQLGSLDVGRSSSNSWHPSLHGGMAPCTGNAGLDSMLQQLQAHQNSSGDGQPGSRAAQRCAITRSAAAIAGSCASIAAAAAATAAASAARKANAAAAMADASHEAAVAAAARKGRAPTAAAAEAGGDGTARSRSASLKQRQRQQWHQEQWELEQQRQQQQAADASPDSDAPNLGSPRARAADEVGRSVHHANSAAAAFSRDNCAGALEHADAAHMMVVQQQQQRQLAMELYSSEQHMQRQQQGSATGQLVVAHPDRAANVDPLPPLLQAYPRASASMPAQGARASGMQQLQQQLLPSMAAEGAGPLHAGMRRNLGISHAAFRPSAPYGDAHATAHHGMTI